MDEKKHKRNIYFLIPNHRFKVTFTKKTRIYSTLPSRIIIANFKLKLANSLDKSPCVLSAIKYYITTSPLLRNPSKNGRKKEQRVQGVPLFAIHPGIISCRKFVNLKTRITNSLRIHHTHLFTYLFYFTRRIEYVPL